MSFYRINVEILPGTTIEEAARETIELSKRYHCLVSFCFNGVEMAVNYEDNPERVVGEWKARPKAMVYKGGVCR